MKSKSLIAQLYLCVLFLLFATAGPAYAGPAVIGLVVGSTNASVGGKTLLPDTTVFSGDCLEVNDGVAAVALGSTSRMIFHRDTVASFRRDSDEVTVLLGQGYVSLFHGQNTMPVRVKVGDISVAPFSSLQTQGEVTARNDVVIVTATDGKLRVEDNGQAIILAKGETIRMADRGSNPTIGLSRGTAKVDAPAAAATAARVARGGLVTTSVTDHTLGRALDSLADCSPVISPHKPH